VFGIVPAKAYNSKAFPTVKRHRADLSVTLVVNSEVLVENDLFND
jgi:hypothetical protein